ncbi:MAG: flavin reductase family protein [Acidobacteriota bacterium]
MNSSVGPISSERFRNVLRLFASGVTLVTTRTADGALHGMTVSAFASVSPEPPLVSVFIDHAHTMHPMLEVEGAVFAVNILGETQQHLSNRFAFTKDEDRFAEGRWSVATTGSPVLEEAIAWLDCRIVARHVAGTHTIYLGEVVDSSVVRADAPPLIYWNRGYRRLRKPE